MGSSSKGGGAVTVGYWYDMNIHAVICHGPVDAVKQFTYGEREAWSGNVTSNASIFVNKPDLFGGESREGGPVGYIDIMFGEDDQGVNDLIEQTRPDSPAYRGLLTVLFRGANIAKRFRIIAVGASKGFGGFTWSAMNPYIKPFWFKVKHITKGRPWYTAKAAIGEDMNPVHIIYDVLTNSKYGLAFSSGRIDDAAFMAAADKCYKEGFGISLVWQGSTTAWDFIQVILNHINGILFIDPANGQFTLKLARDDYDVSTLVTLDPSNIVSFGSFDRAAWGEVTNTVIVTYTDPNTEGSATVTLTNPAAVRAQGGKTLATEVSVLGVRNATLAARIGMRTLRATSAPLAKVSLEVNRIGYDLRPGDVIKLNWPLLGISAMPMRVGEIDYGTLTDGKIKIDAIEDVFGMPTTVYAGSETGYWSDPVVAPVPATEQYVYEAAYYEVNRAVAPSILADYDPAFGFGKMLVVKPHSSMIRYEVDGSSTAGGTYSRVLTGTFVPTATLATAVTQTDTGFALSNIDNLADVALNTWGYIENEAVEFLGYDADNDVYRFNRGVIDTVPAAHAVGSRIFFDVDQVSVDQTERVYGETVYYKPLPANGMGVLPVASASYSALTLNKRYQRPYPPGNFKINGSSYPSGVSYGPVTITWAHRDRTQQTVGLTLQSAGNIGPEAGTTYNIRVYDAATNSLLKSDTTSGTTYTYVADQTKVLLHFDGADASTTITDEIGKVWTAYGDAKLSTTHHKFGVSSLLLDGTGDYLSTPDHADFAINASDFTIEAQVFITAYGANTMPILSRGPTGSSAGYFWGIGTAGQLYWEVAGASLTGGTVPLNTFTHVAVTRQGTSLKMFINGTQVFSGTQANWTDSGTEFRIGRGPGTSTFYFNGRIDEFRFRKGEAAYTSSFTAPSYPFDVEIMPSRLRVEVESLRDGLTSLQKQSATFNLITSDRLLEDGTTRTLEDGTARKMEIS